MWAYKISHNFLCEYDQVAELVSSIERESEPAKQNETLLICYCILVTVFGSVNHRDLPFVLLCETWNFSFKNDVILAL